MITNKDATAKLGEKEQCELDLTKLVLEQINHKKIEDIVLQIKNNFYHSVKIDWKICYEHLMSILKAFGNQPQLKHLEMEFLDEDLDKLSNIINHIPRTIIHFSITINAKILTNLLMLLSPLDQLRQFRLVSVSSEINTTHMNTLLNYPALTELDLLVSKIEHEAIKIAVSSPKLCSLKLNPIITDFPSTSQQQEIETAIKKNRFLTTVNLPFTYITPNTFVTPIASSNTKKFLSFNKIKDHILKQKEVNLALLSPDGMTTNNIKELAKCFNVTNTCISVTLDNRMQPEDMATIINTLLAKKMLHLAFQKINVTKDLAERIAIHPTLVSLSFEGCEIEDGVIITLAKSKTIRRLKLLKDKAEFKPACNLTSRSIQILSESQTLKELFLEMDNPEEAIITFIAANRLQALIVGENSYFSSKNRPGEFLSQILTVLESNTNLVKLSLPIEYRSLKIHKHTQSNFLRHHPESFISYTENIRGEKILDRQLYSRLCDKIIKALNEQTGDHLKNVLDGFRFDPNSHTCEQGNPHLNLFIANEMHSIAINLIQTYSEVLEPNQRDFEGKTALIIAAKTYSADDVFFALLKYLGNKIDLNAQDDDGCTALHYLFAYGKIELISSLLLKGASIDIRDLDNKTPLDYANLPESTIRSILDSISIAPDRDSNVNRNYWLTFGSILNQAEEANLATLSQIKNYIVDGKLDSNFTQHSLTLIEDTEKQRARTFFKFANSYKELESRFTTQTKAVQKTNEELLIENLVSAYEATCEKTRLGPLTFTIIEYLDETSWQQKQNAFLTMYEALKRRLAGKSVIQTCLECNKAAFKEFNVVLQVSATQVYSSIAAANTVAPTTTVSQQKIVATALLKFLNDAIQNNDLAAIEKLLAENSMKKVDWSDYLKKTIEFANSTLQDSSTNKEKIIKLLKSQK